MQNKIETVLIVGEDGNPLKINKDDFKEGHVLFADKVKAKEKVEQKVQTKPKTPRKPRKPRQQKD